MPTNYETDAWKAYAARHYKWREAPVHHPDGSTEQGRILLPDYGIELGDELHALAPSEWK
ncbi:hypothetical protein OV203_26080 [Nannocystis sp. ILAH1]|uniref:hypothetical protein n=1 Tax=Nannocystis sp. ILAH1 TaxID=2996789 RepID=UPI00226DFA66|nr:hypothetical protein [Nannocystis sp. ILAH1]MCY0990639.1 hypothetical protein [Nannocystis sp. ILAH1]